MEHRCKDPGAVQFGNFINYYSFYPAEERIKLLPHDVWLATVDAMDETAKEKPFLVLDVGCNSGALTQLLFTFLSKCTGRPIQMLAVDIDAILVERARENNEHVANITYANVDIMDDIAFEQQVCGFLRMHNSHKFDVVFCFSITMWIHLNHREAGLRQLLQKLSDLAMLFVVEPQPWRCYKSAEKRMKKVGDEFPLFRELTWRAQVEQEIQMFLEVQLAKRKVYECCPSKWKRRICFYR